MTWIYAAIQLTLVSARRMIWSRQTMVNLLLLVMAALVCIAWSLRGDHSPANFINQILLPIYVAFLLPISCLCYATAGIAGDREEGTLVYLLATPLPRLLIYAAKYVSALVLTLAWTLGGLALLGQAAGPVAVEVVAVVWWPVLLATLAYVGLFQLFGALFRRATVVALGYALFLEVLVGSMPGIIKRVAVSFYAQSLIFAAASPFGVEPSGPHHPAMFLPIAAPVAVAVLITAAAGLFLLGGWTFAQREYV
jgi:ABC-2 type transport system permease protein